MLLFLLFYVIKKTSFLFTMSIFQTLKVSDVESFL